MSKPSKARSCTGKVPFSSRAHASAAARNAARTIGDPGLRPYHCSYCGKWHLGHPTKGRKGRRH